MEQTQLKPSSTLPNPDTSSPLFNFSKHLSSPHSNHKTYPTKTPSYTYKFTNSTQPCKDIHLQAKSMTLSADFDASKHSRVKSKHHLPAETKEPSKSKVSKNDSASHGEKKKKKKSLAVVKSEDVVVLERRMSSVSLGGGGRRRSFSGSQVELSDFLASNGAKIVSVDMPPFMQIHAVDCARRTRDSLEKFTSKTLALTLKKEFDGVYGPAWHCIVGTSFGSFVTHSVGGFLYFSLDHNLYILLFKTTVQRAD